MQPGRVGGDVRVTGALVLPKALVGAGRAGAGGADGKADDLVPGAPQSRLRVMAGPMSRRAGALTRRRSTPASALAAEGV